MSPQIVEHHIYAFFCVLVSKRSDERIVFLIKRDNRICAEFFQRFQRLRVATCRSHTTRSQAFRDLHCQLSGNARCAENRYTLPCDELRTPHQRRPRRHRRIGNPRCSRVIQPIRQRDAHPTREGALCERTERTARHSEKNTRPILQPSYAV